MDSEYINFEEKFCTGCTQCVRACPTKAIRVKQNKAAHISGRCIGCCECIRVCPEGSVSSSLSDQCLFQDGKLNVAIVSPILYAQFPGFMPNDVLLGLKQMGFDHAIDLSYYLEMFQYAVEEFIVRNRKTHEAPWPLISPICPVVIRLVALNYPNLLNHILPFKRPTALVAEEIRKKLSQEHGVKKEDIILHHITPCHSKIVSDRMSHAGELACMDRSLGINMIYPELIQKMEEIKDLELNLFPSEHFSFVPNARGPLWGMSGGEIAGMRLEKVIAVSGLKETMAYIEKIEMGLFGEMEYIEFRACTEGCLGGPLTAVDRYLAKSTVQKFLKMFGMGRRMPRKKIHRLFEKKWFFSHVKPEELADGLHLRQAPLTIENMKKIEKLISMIHGNDCAACGAPDCRTFAEDVVRGKADVKNCFKIPQC
jgi:iron only hydrogenase large subunit-like protein